jgi:hypothetical protein
MFTHTHPSETSQRLGEHKNLCCTVPFILIIITLRLSGCCFNRIMFLFNKLNRLFIHADYRNRRIERLTVNFKNIFHICHKRGILLRRNYPLPAEMGPEFVFLVVLNR